jgi:hypothetical protein
MFTLPPKMREAFGSGRWPNRLIQSTGLWERSPFLKGVCFEFVQSLAEIQSGTGGIWGPICPDLTATWDSSRLGRGSVRPVPALPWLDIEQCLPFGGGWWGDDLWLVLDYRDDADSPRIVANEFVREQAGLGLVWREIAPSFDVFWQALGLP